MKSNPHVSILTPCYNSRKFIRETIDSALNQTYQNIELLLVDDGPPDPIKDIVDSYQSSKIRYFHTENQGPAKARNFAAQHSTGDYVAFLNHDDIWVPTKLEDQLAALAAHQAVWIASGMQKVNLITNEVLWDDNGTDYYKNVFYDILEKKYLWSFSSVMIEKQVFFDVGMFSGDIWFMDDRDLYLRIAKEHPIVYLSKVHVYDRAHASNITSNVSMARLFEIHNTVLTNAKKLEPNLPEEVIENSKQMIYRTACVEYLRANDVENMRKMLKRLKFNLKNIKFIPYWFLSLFSDEMIIKIMKGFRKIREKISKSRKTSAIGE